jgi:hypothetical protein
MGIAGQNNMGHLCTFFIFPMWTNIIKYLFSSSAEAFILCTGDEIV